MHKFRFTDTLSGKTMAQNEAIICSSKVMAMKLMRDIDIVTKNLVPTDKISFQLLVH